MLPTTANAYVNGIEGKQKRIYLKYVPNNPNQVSDNYKCLVFQNWFYLHLFGFYQKLNTVLCFDSQKNLSLINPSFPVCVKIVLVLQIPLSPVRPYILPTPLVLGCHDLFIDITLYLSYPVHFERFQNESTLPLKICICYIMKIFLWWSSARGQLCSNFLPQTFS